LKTNPKFRAALTRAPSSGDWAWYSKQPRDYRSIDIIHHSQRILQNTADMCFLTPQVYLTPHNTSKKHDRVSVSNTIQQRLVVLSEAPSITILFSDNRIYYCEKQ